MLDKTNCIICNVQFQPKRWDSKTCALNTCKLEYARLLKKSRKRQETDLRTLKCKTKK